MGIITNPGRQIRSMVVNYLPWNGYIFNITTYNMIAEASRDALDPRLKAD